jgi:hypothetical protein
MDSNMKRVRMFCDWDNTSYELIQRLKDQTDGFDGEKYGDITFVWDDSYTHAVVFNYPTMDLKSPPENNIALLLEPPQVSEMMHGPWRNYKFDNVRQIYSFVNDPPHKPVYALGFATVPKGRILRARTGSSHSDSNRHQLCMIASNKVLTPYHEKRLEIKEALLASNINMHFYGRGLTGRDRRIKGEIPPMRKYETLRQYSFVIDFENSFNAVTDKFFDPILCGTIPINNSPILHQYAEGSFVYVNFNDSVDDIVEQMRGIRSLYAADYNIGRTQESILQGRMCLAKWIRNKVNE